MGERLDILAWQSYVRGPPFEIGSVPAFPDRQRKPFVVVEALQRRCSGRPLASDQSQGLIPSHVERHGKDLVVGIPVLQIEAVRPLVQHDLVSLLVSGYGTGQREHVLDLLLAVVLGLLPAARYAAALFALLPVLSTLALLEHDPVVLDVIASEDGILDKRTDVVVIHQPRQFVRWDVDQKRLSIVLSEVRGQIGSVGTDLDRIGAHPAIAQSDTTAEVGQMQRLVVGLGCPGLLHHGLQALALAISVIEGVEVDQAVLLPLCHPVELVLHVRGVGIVDQLAERAVHAGVHGEAGERRDHGPVLFPDIAPVEQRGDDRRIGAGSSDALLLQLPDETGLAVARRRRRHMFARGQDGVGEPVAFLERRKTLQLLVLIPVVAVHLEISGEQDDGAG